MSDIKVINLDDRIKYGDEHKILIDDKVEDTSPRIKTRIEVYERDVKSSNSNDLGELLFSEDNYDDPKLKFIDHNELHLSGGLFTLSKLSNVNVPLKIQTINTDLGISADEPATSIVGLRKEHGIIGFGIGLGGCTDVFDTVKPVYYSDRTIPNMIPIRKVPKANDLVDTEKVKYFLRKDTGTYIEYYGKKFETDPIIEVVFDEPGNPSVPANVDTDPNKTRVINSYLKYTLRINKEDVREYFKLDGGGIRKCRVNTVGLITAYPDTPVLGYTEFKGAQVFSKINMNNEPLDNETKELIIIYKIYI